MDSSPARNRRALVLVSSFSIFLSACSGGNEEMWAPAFDATEVGWLLSTWGSGDGTRFAVGGSPGEGAAVYFDGMGWSELTLPPGTPLLTWVYGFPGGPVFMVGEEGTVLRRQDGGFETLSSGTQEDLWGVWGASPDDLWVVGGSGRADATATALRFDGQSFAAAPVPVLVRSGVRAFFKVWGTSASDVYVVGQNGVVLHWDGASIEELFVGTSEDLISLWGTSGDNLILVGGRSNGVVVRWDGEEWLARDLAPLPGLNGVFMRRPGVAHLSGIEGTLAVLDVEALEAEPADVPERQTFHAVHGDDVGDLYAVGGNLSASSAPYTGLAYQRELADAE